MTAQLRVLYFHGQLHGRELLLPRQLQVQATPFVGVGTADVGNGVWLDHSHYSHLGQEDDCPGHRRVFSWLFDGGRDGGGRHAYVCRSCYTRG